MLTGRKPLAGLIASNKSKADGLSSASGVRLVSKVWPVYGWDDSPPIWALLVPFELALEELNPYGSSVVTESELKRALRDCEIATSDAGDRLQEAIKAFYVARKDRRIQKGYTPSDNGNSAH